MTKCKCVCFYGRVQLCVCVFLWKGTNVCVCVSTEGYECVCVCVSTEGYECVCVCVCVSMVIRRLKMDVMLYIGRQTCLWPTTGGGD